MGPAACKTRATLPAALPWTLAAAVGLAMTVYAAGVLGLDGTRATGHRIVPLDYLAFFMAGDLAAQGRLAELYDVAAQRAYQQDFVTHHGGTWTGYCPFLNPPHYAAAMSLLSRLGYEESLATWWLLSLACFTGTCLIWRRWLGRERVNLLVPLAICAPPWIMTFVAGQNTFLSLLVLTLFCDLLLRRRDGWAGLVLSLLAYKFHLLLVPAALLLAKRRWRAVLGLAAGIALTLAATAALFEPAALTAYLHAAPRFSDLAHHALPIHKQQSWYGFFALLGGPHLSPAAATGLAGLASLASLTLLVPLWRRPWPTGQPTDTLPEPRLALPLGGLLVAVLVTSPHLFHYDMLLATLPAALWLCAARDAELAQATRAVRPIVVLLYGWLSVTLFTTTALPVQLSAPLMLAWLLALARATRQPAPTYRFAT